MKIRIWILYVLLAVICVVCIIESCSDGPLGLVAR